MPEVSLYGIRPTERFGAWFSLLPQNRKESCRSLPDPSGSKQPEVPNSMLIAPRNMLAPTVNEFFQ
jgi:hypothetical protein